MRRGLVVVVVGTLLLAGCGDDGTGGDDAPAQARVVSINLLHGTACAEGTDRCDLPGRVALFAEQLAEAGCPELVGVQEANQRTVAALAGPLAAVCGGAYEIVTADDPGLDREIVLTNRPVLGSGRFDLAGPLRTALWVRVATDVGAVDFTTTHLASSSDDRPCDPATCPPPCEATDTVNTCQGREVAAVARQVAGPDSVVVLSGDLNARPDGPTVAAITAAGFVDTHLAAGNPECAPATGDQCTSGRVDDSMADLSDPASRQRERIDYVFVLGRQGCEVTAPTGLFNAEPAEGEPAFPSDHTGVEATIACPTSAEQRATAATATVPSTAPPTTTAGRPVDAEVEAAITEAFTNVFDGSVGDPEVKLSSLEAAEELRPSFLESFAATRAVAARIRLRIDAITAEDDTRASVTYSLLLDGTAVLDHLPGEAVLADGRWLVSLRTYCDVATQGAEVIPEPCR